MLVEPVRLIIIDNGKDRDRWLTDAFILCSAPRFLLWKEGRGTRILSSSAEVRVMVIAERAMAELIRPTSKFCRAVPRSTHEHRVNENGVLTSLRGCRHWYVDSSHYTIARRHKQISIENQSRNSKCVCDIIVHQRHEFYSNPTHQLCR